MPLVALVAAYLLGSVPTAYLAGRLLRGVDLRERGSGNLGATNVFREVGAVPAIVVLLIDVAKGWIAVRLFPGWFGITAGPWLVVGLGMVAVVGHSRPVFLAGRGGGKGVATAAGVFLALTPLAALFSLGAFAAVVAGSRYVSAGSVAGAVVLPVAILLTRGPVAPELVASTLLAAMVIWGHRANLRRIAEGSEHRIGRRHGETT